MPNFRTTVELGGKTANRDAEPEARHTFDALSNSNKKWHTYQIGAAKSDETRRRRIDKSIDALRHGHPR